MRFLIPLIALLGLACTISPVISDPGRGGGGGRYGGCRRAAEDYCRHVADSPPSETEACVARHTLECVSAKH